jgi:hypothetical protein
MTRVYATRRNAQRHKKKQFVNIYLDMKLRLLLCVVLIAVLLLATTPTSDAKRRKRKSSKSKDKKSGKDKKLGREEFDTDEITYKSQDDINDAVNKIGEKIMDADEGEMSDEEYEEFKEKKAKEELEAKKNIFRAESRYGVDSRERANALHALGKVYYEQVKMEEAFEVAKEVVRIHTNLYGPNDEETAKALGNFASVACRMRREDICRLVMYRVTDILINLHGLQSNPVLLQRGRMMTFQVPEGDKHEGIDQETFEEEIADAYEELEEKKAKEEAAKGKKRDEQHEKARETILGGNKGEDDSDEF